MVDCLSINMHIRRLFCISIMLSVDFCICNGECFSQLGMESGDIQEQQIVASSYFQNDPLFGPQAAGLNSVSHNGNGGGWGPSINDTVQPWIYVDLEETMRVTGVITQGRHSSSVDDQWVRTFLFCYKETLPSSHPYIINIEDDCFPTIFTGNIDNNSPVVNFLPYGIEVQLVVIVPVTWSDHPVMRFEILGCSVSEYNDDFIEESSIQSTVNYIDNVKEMKRLELVEIDRKVGGEKRFTEPVEGVLLWTSNRSTDDGIVSVNINETLIQLDPANLDESFGVIVLIINSSEVEEMQSLSDIPMTVISDIISINVYDANLDEVTDVNVNITLPTFAKTSQQNLNDTCCFLDTTSNISFWSTEGCSIETDNNQATSATCVCNHLTSFAILLQVESSSSKEVKIMSILTMIGISISTVFLVLILLIIQMLPELRKNERFVILRHLVISLLCVNTSFTCLSLNIQHLVLCIAIAASLHYSLLVAFLWMILWCTELYCKIRHPFADHQKRFKYFRVIGWMLPLVGVATVVGVTREEYASSSCWLNTSNRVILTFIVPVVTTILTVSVQLMVVFCEVYKKSTSMPTSEHDEHLKLKKLRSISYRVLLLAPVVGLPWVTGFFVILNDSMYTQFIFIVSAAFQGLWIWITQFCLSQEVRYAFRKHCKCCNNQISSSKTITVTSTRTDLQPSFT